MSRTSVRSPCRHPRPVRPRDSAIEADQKDEGCCQHRTNRRPAGTVTRPSGFHSFLATPLRSYLARQRSLGRRYCKEEWILRGLDLVLHRDYPCGRVFTRAMFDRWALELATLSPTSRRLRMLCVAKFCRYLAWMRPTTFVPNPRNFPKQLPHRAPYLLSEHEVVRLLAGTRTINPSRKNPLRHATMRVALLLLYCCGLRRGELLKLRLADIDTEQQLLRIQQTKFYKSRLVPCSSSVGEELRKYLQLRRRQGMPMDPSMPLLWNGRSGRTSGALSPTAISANWFRILPMRGSSRPSRTSATHSRPTPQLCRNGLAARLRCRPTSPSDTASAGPLPGPCFSSVHSLLSEVH